MPYHTRCQPYHTVTDTRPAKTMTYHTRYQPYHTRQSKIPHQQKPHNTIYQPYHYLSFQTRPSQIPDRRKPFHTIPDIKRWIDAILFQIPASHRYPTGEKIIPYKKALYHTITPSFACHRIDGGQENSDLFHQCVHCRTSFGVH